MSDDLEALDDAYERDNKVQMERDDIEVAARAYEASVARLKAERDQLQATVEEYQRMIGVVDGVRVIAEKERDQLKADLIHQRQQFSACIESLVRTLEDINEEGPHPSGPKCTIQIHKAKRFLEDHTNARWTDAVMLAMTLYENAKREVEEIRRELFMCAAELKAVREHATPASSDSDTSPPL